MINWTPASWSWTGSLRCYVETYHFETPPLWLLNSFSSSVSMSDSTWPLFSLSGTMYSKFTGTPQSSNILANRYWSLGLNTASVDMMTESMKKQEKGLHWVSAVPSSPTHFIQFAWSPACKISVWRPCSWKLWTYIDFDKPLNLMWWLGGMVCQELYFTSHNHSHTLMY